MICPQGLCESLGPLVKNAIVSQLDLCHRFIDLQGLCKSLSSLSPDVIAFQVDVSYRHICFQGLGYRLHQELAALRIVVVHFKFLNLTRCQSLAKGCCFCFATSECF